MAVRIELEGRRADADVAWRRLGDTDFLNRAAHAGTIAMQLVPRTGGSPELVGTLSGPLGLQLPFVETRNGWVHRKWFRQERAFERGPIARSAFLLTLEPDGDGVRPHITLEVEPSSRLLSPFVGHLLSGYRTGWGAVLAALPAPGVAAAPALERPLGDATRAALDRWAKAAPASVVAAVRDLLVHERDHALRQLRAFAVADRYGLDRMETLVGMLRAVPDRKSVV
jgi:hypothetical protein